MSSSSATSNRCFNRNCSRVLESAGSCFIRRGWLLRNGDFALLCNLCGCTFEEGRFCDTFHPHESGWRSCESCGKRIHCGCIVSAHAFVLLDGGGIQCLMCESKQPFLVPKPSWPTSLSPPQPLPVHHKEQTSGTTNKMVGPCPSGPWWCEANPFNTSNMNLDFQSKMAFLAGLTNDFDRNLQRALLLKPPFESSGIHAACRRFMDGREDYVVYNIPKCRKPVLNHEQKPSSSVPNPLRPSCLKDKQSTSCFPCSISAYETVSPFMVSGSQPEKSTILLVSGESLAGGSSNANMQVCSGDNMLLPQYCTAGCKEQLQRVSGNSGTVITPLFEKVLSASDVGRVGRLVLPKKCAENYFPPISPPEGLPINVLDEKGNEWILRFRSWTNNSSRMYVLEGLTPCIQSLQLHAGDVVKFSRLEPDGKLILGFRKACGPRSEQVKQQVWSNGMGADGDAGAVDPHLVLGKVDKSRCAAKTGGESVPRMRNNCMFSSKHKRMKFDHVDTITLKVTLGEAQGLFRPSADHLPNIVTIEEFEIEEYEVCPMIGWPTIFARNSTGEQVRWAQCEACFKWRKLPFDALLSFGWTCSRNSWDPERSSCDTAQELKAEQLEDLLPTRHPGAFENPKDAKQEFDPARYSGGGVSKQEDECTYEACVFLRHSCPRMSMRLENKEPVKEAETAYQKQDQHRQSSHNLEPRAHMPECNDLGHMSADTRRLHADSSTGDPSKSFLNQIDLNIQPERQEEHQAALMAGCRLPS